MRKRTKKIDTAVKVSLIVGVASAVALVVAAIIQGYFAVEAAKVTRSEPTKPAQNIQPLPCPANSAGYVAFHAKSGNHCFKGTGVITYHLDDVTSIETGSYRVSWRYMENGREARAPSNSDWHVHVCSGRKIEYSDPVQLVRIFVADAEFEKCTDTLS